MTFLIATNDRGDVVGLTDTAGAWFARHYDPATARFLTKDPARDDGEESAYQYCAGDPVGKVDPTGEAAVSIRTPEDRLKFWQGLWGDSRLGDRYFGKHLWVTWTRGTVSRLCSANPQLPGLKRTLAALYAVCMVMVSEGGTTIVTGLVSVGVPGTSARDAVSILTARAHAIAAKARTWEAKSGHMLSGVHRSNRVHLRH